MTRVEVEKECAKAGWTLANDWRETGGVQPVVYKPAKAPHERAEIGRGETPHEAYLEACRREGKSPF